jgi:hypothetical protein
MFIENNINENPFIKQMATILCVEKLGSIKELKVKNVTEAELYKKAGLKTGQDFKQQTTWNVKVNKKTYNICIYGKTKGRANTENKYDFPPPIDNTLFFGNCIIVCKDDDTIVSITASEWDKIYEELFGGFEDIGDETSEDESDEDDNIPKTKSGYAKDGFVVDDGEDESEEYTSESEEEKPPKAKRSTKNKLENKMKISVPTNVFDVETDIDFDFIDELQEEEYV